MRGLVAGRRLAEPAPAAGVGRAGVDLRAGAPTAAPGPEPRPATARSGPGPLEPRVRSRLR